MPPSHVNSPPLYRVHGFWIALIVLLGVIFYANSFRGEFVFDDEMMITHSKGLAKAPLQEWFRPSPRVVGAATFGLNYKLGGLNTFGYHLLNLVIHISAAIVLYWLTWRTFQSPRLAERYAAAAIPLAGVIALVWALHPLQTQSVTYIVQRYESLMGLFFLLTIACLVRGADSGKSIWYVASLGCCMLGMGTKEVMAAAPIMALWYDRVFLSESWRELRRKRWAYYAVYLLAFAALIFFIASQWHWIAKRGTLFNEHLSPLAYAMNQGPVILHYIRLAFWPQGQNLDYGWRPSEDYAALYAADLVILILLALTIWAIWKAPVLGFLGGWFFVILAPSSSFAPIIDLAFEHRMYLPLLTLAALTVVGGYELIVRLAKPLQRVTVAGVLSAVVILSLGATTMLRNEVYDTPLSLWTDVMHKAPHHWRSYLNIGNYYAQRKEFAKALSYFTKAYELHPSDHRVLSNYASILETLKQDYPLAETCYQRALIDNPEAGLVRYNYGAFLNKLGRYAEAKVQLEQAYKINDQFPRIRVTLAAIDIHLGDKEDAKKYLLRQLNVNPRDPIAHNMLGVCLTKEDDEQAALHFLTAIQLDPQSVEAHNNVADLFVRLGRYDLAQAHLKAALAVDPQNSTVRRNLAAVEQAIAASE
ncbi:tetratricopeptide repeat protein [Blastopirellula sp. JC732]|uniref:Tetratricopeptide repeat protein n=1 Tax=Blastopirellula sediminis TaxID=2894196 RepID=A0A9X1MSH6_9BACT|nr:tetratricopeptide repeat protein [Blastopirellula sediminis]MCC9605887.1 tetratricopeptide repeat protein [Blastopirellula sediminis]MCC9630814.1 tetratricopeptide repeat protein [Blastopirellula sediminis]